MKVAYIDQYKETFGVQPICDVLAETDAPIAPSTYYAARSRPPSARSLRDEQLTEEICRIHADNYGVYGGPQDSCRPGPRRRRGGPLHRRTPDESGRTSRRDPG